MGVLSIVRGSGRAPRARAVLTVAALVYSSAATLGGLAIGGTSVHAAAGVVDVFDVGGLPQGIAVDGTKVYVTNQGTGAGQPGLVPDSWGTVNVFDTASGEAVWQRNLLIEAGSGLLGDIVADGDDLWVLSHSYETGNPIGPPRSSAHLIWISGLSGNWWYSASEIDPLAVTLAAGGDYLHIASLPGGVSPSGGMQTRLKYPADELSPWGQPVARHGENSEGVAVDGGVVYYTNSTDEGHVLSGFNTFSGVGTGTVPLDYRPGEIAAANGKVYVTHPYDDKLSIVDSVTGAVTLIDVGDVPLGVAVDGPVVYVVNLSDDTVSVIDTAHNNAVSTVAVGDTPVAVAAGGGRAYVVNALDATVSVIEPGAVTEPVATPVSPAVSVDAPATGQPLDTSATLNGTGYTANAVTWTPAAATAAAATAYTATITLTTAPGFTFTGLTSATVNGQPAIVSDNTGSTITLAHTFPATAKATQAPLAITDPGTLTYGGQAFTLAATGGSGAGAVAFSVPAGNGVLDITPTGTASIVGTGTVTVTATKAADANHDAATTTRDVTIGKAWVPVSDLPVLAIPSLGSAFDTTAPPSGVGFTAGPVAWTSDGFPVTGQPAPGAVYTATVTLFAEPGYTFEGVTLAEPAALHARVAVPSVAVVDNTGDEITLAYTFAATPMPLPTLVEQRTRTWSDETVAERSFEFVLALQVDGATAGTTPWPNTNHWTLIDVAPGEMVARRIATATGTDTEARTSTDINASGDYEDGEVTSEVDTTRVDADPVYLDAVHVYDLVQGNKQVKVGQVTVRVDWEGHVTATVTWNDGRTSSGIKWGLYNGALDVPKAPGQLNGKTIGQTVDATIAANRLSFTLPGRAATRQVTRSDPQYGAWSQWTAQAAPYRTVSLVANINDGEGGTRPMAGQVANTATALNANTFSRAGYRLVGWNTSTDGTGVAYTPGATYPFITDITLYAQWQAISG